MIKLGYHPDPDDVWKPLSHGDFERVIVLDEDITELYDGQRAVRTTSAADSGLPSGLYWFVGMSSSILMQVGLGRPGASSELEMESWDDENDHPLVEALRWAEHFWERGTTVPNPQFRVGDRAITVPGGVDVEIRARTFDQGSWAYRVWKEGGFATELEHKLTAIEVSDEPDQWVLGQQASAARFGATLTRTKLRGRFANTIYSFRATRTVFRPYQFKPVLKLLSSGQARILIADEVGLGKTIEAGLIWTELEARHEADRVLIVCPSALRDKWRDEMLERFGFDVTHLDAEELKRFLEQHREGRLPRRNSYVVSLEALRTWKALEELEENPPEFDLVIVDEAHSMRNNDTKSYRLGVQLSEWTTGSNMIFLTATPINLRETDLLHLLGLLEPADFDQVEDLEARLKPNAVLNQIGKQLTRSDMRGADFAELLEGLRGLVFEKAVTARPEFSELRDILGRAPLAPKDVALARRLLGELNALSTIVTRTRRAEVDEKKAIRDANPGIRVVWSEPELRFYEEYLRWCQKRADVAGTPMYFSMQMPIRLASTSVHIAARNVLQADPEAWIGDSEGGRDVSSVEPHAELLVAAKHVLQVPDSKAARLGEVLRELHELNRQALLFTWSKATLRYLHHTYAKHYRIAVLNGDVRHDQRRRIMKDFRAGRYEFVFANRVASEGLDFEFCSAVINYDLPWNPMEIEQRIGRIDRIGQQSEKILIRNFYNEDAIDSRIMYRVLNRIAIFERSIGELEPIIGQHMEVLHAAMDFRLSKQEQFDKAAQFLAAIEAQREGLREVAESAAALIISNDVEIDGLEDELMTTGRYVGQEELARLLSDWVITDGGEPLIRSDDGKAVELRGNATMAGRVMDLVRTQRRTRSETGSLVADLQAHLPIRLSLDQELARTSEIDLLAATHPLVMAAADVPGHRQARFASVKVPAGDSLDPGRYLVVLAHAERASRGGDEIWASAVDLSGESAPSSIAESVLSALASGRLGDGPHIDGLPLQRLARRAQRELERRLREIQERRDAEAGAMREARRALLSDQHQRKMRGIRRRMETILERDRNPKILRLVEGQLRRQQQRYDQLLVELDTRKSESVSLRYLAVCAMEIVP